MIIGKRQILFHSFANICILRNNYFEKSDKLQIYLSASHSHGLIQKSACKPKQLKNRLTFGRRVISS